MEQITAKETLIQQLKEDNLIGHFDSTGLLWKSILIAMDKHSSLRSVSETKEPDGYNEFELRQVIAKYKNEHKYLGTTEGLAKLIIERFPVYFSPVPVSEVGQMEESEIQKLAFEKYPVNEQGLVSGWEDINKDLREGFIEALRLRLPVPNTKTVEGEDIKKQKERMMILFEAVREKAIGKKQFLEEVDVLLSSLRSNEKQTNNN